MTSKNRLSSHDAPAGPDGRPDEADSSQTHSDELARLFREHNEALVNFLALRLRSVQEAKEVAQEAYVRLLQLQRQDTASFLRAYLFRIASNLAIDRARRRNTETRFNRAELFEELTSSADEPERRTMGVEELSLVWGYLGELPESVRRAFLLFRLEELSQEEIAARLGVTDRMVRKYITRALMHCRLRLDGLGREEVMERLKS